MAASGRGRSAVPARLAPRRHHARVIALAELDDELGALAVELRGRALQQDRYQHGRPEFGLGERLGA